MNLLLPACWLWVMAALGPGSRLTRWCAVCPMAWCSSALSPSFIISRSSKSWEPRASAVPLSGQQHQPWVWSPEDGSSDVCGQMRCGESGEWRDLGGKGESIGQLMAAPLARCGKTQGEFPVGLLNCCAKGRTSWGCPFV